MTAEALAKPDRHLRSVEVGEAQEPIGHSVVIISQGEAVPTNSAEVGNPGLIKTRMAGTALNRVLLKSNGEAGQTPLPGIDASIRQSMGLAVASVIELHAQPTL
jgi:hypothetical protein